MSMQNLSIIFGPTLFSQTIANGSGGMADATLQNVVRSRICDGVWSANVRVKAIETILTHYNDIFVDETEL